jgi:D-sedoheptulose 7-phosphate isomerase
MTTQDLLAATIRSIQALDHESIDRMARQLAGVRDILMGRVFVLGNGGGAGHASHAVCDLRKLCQLDSYCPSDNASELTARVNDDGWESAYQEWLRGSRICENDALMVISVGGGSFHPPVSVNLVYAVDLAIERGAAVLAIVGRDGGHAKLYAHTTVLIPCDTPDLVTPVTEGVQAVVLHALAVHPVLATHKAKWEGLA